MIDEQRAEVLRGAFGIEVHAKALTTKQRHALPAADYAIPERLAYPIDTPERARSALARVSANGSPEEQRRVRDAVKMRYPKMQVSGG